MAQNRRFCIYWDIECGKPGDCLKYLEITGGMPLSGTVRIQGSKNAVLPILTACLLGDGGCIIKNCPAIGDVKDLLTILRSLGCSAVRQGNTVKIDGETIKKYEIRGTEAARIRSSVLFLGALLGKMGKVLLPMPGGCAIGARPIDLHLQAMQQMGAHCSIGGDAAEAAGQSCTAEQAQWVRLEAERLHGAVINFAFSSVGATENAVLAAVMAQGETLIRNAAQEPEIDELCAFLNLRGAKITRLQSGDIQIQGVDRLLPVTYQMRPDRIVAGTYLLAAAATRGEIQIPNCPWEELQALWTVLEQMGAYVERSGSMVRLCAERVRMPIPYIETAPYPGFPTDLQSQLMAVLCRIPGESCICERLFENRFATAKELGKMGAEIQISGRCARIKGTDFWHQAVLEAPDLRGGAALVIGALQAEGCTQIRQVEYIERGYEDITRDLQQLGAHIHLMCTQTHQEENR